MASVPMTREIRAREKRKTRRQCMRDLTPDEVAAMWLYGEEYARQPLGIVDWYTRQPDSRKRIIGDFVREMMAAIDRSAATSGR